MSLNGLDEAKVKEAYDCAVAELGGWYVNLLVVDFRVARLGKLVLTLLVSPKVRTQVHFER
jgi:hypothetical protein